MPARRRTPSSLHDRLESLLTARADAEAEVARLHREAEYLVGQVRQAQEQVRHYEGLLVELRRDWAVHPPHRDRPAARLAGNDPVRIVVFGAGPSRAGRRRPHAGRGVGPRDRSAGPCRGDRRERPHGRGGTGSPGPGRGRDGAPGAPADVVLLTVKSRDVESAAYTIARAFCAGPGRRALERAWHRAAGSERARRGRVVVPGSVDDPRRAHGPGPPGRSRPGAPDRHGGDGPRPESVARRLVRATRRSVRAGRASRSASRTTSTGRSGGRSSSTPRSTRSRGTTGSRTAVWSRSRGGARRSPSLARRSRRRPRRGTSSTGPRPSGRSSASPGRRPRTGRACSRTSTAGVRPRSRRSRAPSPRQAAGTGSRCPRPSGPWPGPDAGSRTSRPALTPVATAFPLGPSRGRHGREAELHRGVGEGPSGPPEGRLQRPPATRRVGRGRPADRRGAPHAEASRGRRREDRPPVPPGPSRRRSGPAVHAPARSSIGSPPCSASRSRSPTTSSASTRSRG